MDKETIYQSAVFEVIIALANLKCAVWARYRDSRLNTDYDFSQNIIENIEAHEQFYKRIFSK